MHRLGELAGLVGLWQHADEASLEENHLHLLRDAATGADDAGIAVECKDLGGCLGAVHAATEREIHEYDIRRCAGAIEALVDFDRVLAVVALHTVVATAVEDHLRHATEVILVIDDEYGAFAMLERHGGVVSGRGRLGRRRIMRRREDDAELGADIGRGGDADVAAHLVNEAFAGGETDAIAIGFGGEGFAEELFEILPLDAAPSITHGDLDVESSMESSITTAGPTIPAFLLLVSTFTNSFR